MHRLPLADHPSISTSNLDEAKATYARQRTPILIEPLDRSIGFRWQSNRVAIGSVTLTAQEYGGAFRASSEDAGAVFTASFPLSDITGQARIAGSTLDVARGRSTFINSPSGPRSFTFGSTYRGLQLVIEEEDALTMVRALTGRVPREAIWFEPRMALDSGVGAALERLVTFTVSEIDRRGPLVESPLVAARFAEALLANLLVGQPHSARYLFDAKPDGAEPRHVRIAAEFLEANAAEPIRLADLARASEVSIRALQTAFLKYRGSTPMQFLRARRLDRARELLSAHAPRSVREIAVECGFSHLGRFSGVYLARFGEHPSATRARRR